MGHQGKYGNNGEKKRLEQFRHAGFRDSKHRKEKGLSVERESLSWKGITQGVQVGIVPAKAGDFDFIRQLSRSAFKTYGSYQDVVSQWFQSEMTETFIGRVGRKPVGFAMLGLIMEGDSIKKACELLAIAVEPDHRHKGIGQGLLNAVERKAFEWQTTRIFLHTAKINLPARNLFAGNRFVSWGLKKQFYPAGQDALVMSKVIKG